MHDSVALLLGDGDLHQVGVSVRSGSVTAADDERLARGCFDNRHWLSVVERVEEPGHDRSGPGFAFSAVDEPVGDLMWIRPRLPGSKWSGFDARAGVDDAAAVF